MKCFYFSKKRR